MLLKITFLVLLTIVVTSQTSSESKKKVRIDTGSFTHCYLNIEDIQTGIFTCIPDDKTPQRFNSTHAWYIENDIKCIAAIPKIKEIAKGKCRRIHPHLVQTPPVHGYDTQGKPIKDKDVFQ